MHTYFAIFYMIFKIYHFLFFLASGWDAELEKYHIKKKKDLHVSKYDILTLTAKFVL